MEFGRTHGPLVPPAQRPRVGAFGEHLSPDGGRVPYDGQHNRPYPGQRLSPEVTVLPVIPSKPVSPHILYKLDDETPEIDDAAQRGFFSRLRARRRSSAAAQERLGRTVSRQTTSSEGAVSLDSDEGVWRGGDDGPGPYELYGQLDRAQLARLYTAIGAYHSRWATLPALPRRPEWTFASIPWPSTSHPTSPVDLDIAAIRAFLVALLGYGLERHQRYGTELQRWQPDDFAAKWLINVKSSERAKVVEGVSIVRRVLNELRNE